METNSLSIHGAQWKDHFPVIRENEVHLWRVSLTPSKAVLEACEKALSSREMARIEFFDFDRVKQNYLVSQGALRLILGRYLELEAQEIQLGRHAKGKPFSLNDEGLYFNISNSGNYCVLAFTRNGEVGIDLEEVRPLADLDEMITKNFSFDERLYIRQKKEEELRRFFFMWTVKEAYLKAVGIGMRIEPQQLDFRVRKNEVTLLSVNGMQDYEDWMFQEIPMGNDYVRTLAYGGKDVRFHDFEMI